VEKARLSKTQGCLQPREGTRELKRQILAATQQVFLGDGNVADDALAGRVAGAERKLASRLLHDLHFQNHAVGCRSGPTLDSHRLEEAERLQPLLGLVDHELVVGVALSQTELATDDIVPRARVAEGVDALDVD